MVYEHTSFLPLEVFLPNRILDFKVSRQARSELCKKCEDLQKLLEEERRRVSKLLKEVAETSDDNNALRVRLEEAERQEILILKELESSKQVLSTVLTMLENLGGPKI